VKGIEEMGNNRAVVLDRLASAMLAEVKRGVSQTRLRFPTESLTITDLFPGEIVTFPFSTLPQQATQEFNTCFRGASSSNRSVSSDSHQ
jgi:hypothetical protein